MPHDAVMIARGLADSIRLARDAEAKPPNIIEWTAPSLPIARVAKSAAGIIGTRNKLRLNRYLYENVSTITHYR